MEIMQLINLLLYGLFLGLLASHFAKKRGRTPWIWFLIGFFFSLLGVLTLFLLPKVSKQASMPQKPTPAFLKKSDSWMKMWYYLDPTHTQQGPLEFPDLIKMCKNQGLSDKSYIWGEGMSEWKRLCELPELKREIEQELSL